MNEASAKLAAKPFARRLRERREELRLTQSELANRSVLLVGPGSGKRIISRSTVKKMESDGENRYRLPTRKWAGTTAIELIAQAVDVPLGYFLAGFPREEIEGSMFGAAVRNQRIELLDTLRQSPHKTLQHFIENLPETEEGLFALPLHSYSNQFAFAVIFQIERLYAGLEMLLANELPLIFWDDDDIELWVENMGLETGDATCFRGEFSNYKSFFRDLIERREKRYKVVVNYSTLVRFLQRKTSASKRKVIDEVCSFLSKPGFDLLICQLAEVSGRPSRYINEVYEAHECEVLCKTQTIPTSLAGTVSIQIMQTAPHLRPVGYFVSPAPRELTLIQREINRIEEAWATAIDQYRVHTTGALPFGTIPSETQLSDYTIELLRAI